LRWYCTSKYLDRLAFFEDERRPITDTDSSERYLGPNLRVAGSLHTDVWTATAADVAQRGVVAVFPVSGWWKDRPDRNRSDDDAHNSVIASFETLGQDVDIGTPVAAEVGIPIGIET
jgi:hypothetical protein